MPTDPERSSASSGKLLKPTRRRRAAHGSSDVRRTPLGTPLDDVVAKAQRDVAALRTPEDGLSAMERLAIKAREDHRSDRTLRLGIDDL